MLKYACIQHNSFNSDSYRKLVNKYRSDQTAWYEKPAVKIANRVATEFTNLHLAS